MKKIEKTGNLNWIREESERRLIIMRYSEVSRKHYMRVFNWIKNFQEGYGEKDYTKEIGQRFLVEYQLQPNHVSTMYRNTCKIVKRINEILDGKQFTPRFYESKVTCPPCFLNWLNMYIKSLEKRGLSKPTITARRGYVTHLLHRFRGTVSLLENLSAQNLYSIFTQYDWPSVTLAAAKDLLVFCLIMV